MKKLLFLCLLFVGASLSSAEPYLFQDGKALWKITFRTSDDESEPTVKLASRELNSLLLRISDADIPDEKASSKDQVKICFGVEEKLKREEVNIYWDGQILHFTAGAPQSLISAVYYFVQKEMGVRWLWPGEDGEFIPKKTSYSIRKDLKLHHLPAFRYRGMHTCGDWYKIHEFRTWMAHNYVNVHRHGTNFKNDLRFIKMLSTHNVYLEKSYFKTHPEYFAEIGGKRHTTQVCLNNHDVADILYERFAETLRKHPEIEILSIFPSDNQDYCQCEKCRENGVSTSWFDFFNEMAERLKKDFPYIKLSTIAYQGYISVPKNPVRNAEFVEYASYPRCNIHRYGDPRCTINVSV